MIHHSMARCDTYLDLFPVDDEVAVIVLHGAVVNAVNGVVLEHCQHQTTQVHTSPHMVNDGDTTAASHRTGRLACILYIQLNAASMYHVVATVFEQQQQQQHRH